MQRDAAWAMARFASARVARLATVGTEGRPHVVPIVFAVSGSTIYSAVDAKPKTSLNLKRLRNITANPQVSVLVDHFAEDWTQLWWARADALARLLDPDAPEQAFALALLADRYSQYVEQPPPGPVIALDVQRWSGWSANVKE